MIKTLAFGLLKTVLEVLFIPGLYLYNMGVDLTFALAIQAIFNLSLLFGLIQFITGKSFKGME